jgi:hypothetical protein
MRCRCRTQFKDEGSITRSVRLGMVYPDLPSPRSCSPSFLSLCSSLPFIPLRNYLRNYLTDVRPSSIPLKTTLLSRPAHWMRVPSLSSRPFYSSVDFDGPWEKGVRRPSSAHHTYPFFESGRIAPGGDLRAGGDTRLCVRVRVTFILGILPRTLLCRVPACVRRSPIDILMGVVPAQPERIHSPGGMRRDPGRRAPGLCVCSMNSCFVRILVALLVNRIQESVFKSPHLRL